MATLVTHPDPDTASVLVELAGASTPTGIQLQRSVNGGDWVNVRDDGGLLNMIRDRELPLRTQLVSYHARPKEGGNWTAAAGLVNLDLSPQGMTWIKDPLVPARNVAVWQDATQTDVEYDQDFFQGAALNATVGVVYSSPMRGRAETMQVRCLDESTLNAVLALARSGNTLLVQTPVRPQRYVQVNGKVKEQQNPFLQQWLVPLPILEVAAP